MSSSDNLTYTHISSKHNLFDLKLREVWKYRNLAILFTKRQFKVAYKQTILGPLWLFINPLITSIFQVILFGNIAKLSTDGIPQILFYMSGNAVWGFFAACVENNAHTFTGNAYLFGKVYFPRLIMPISSLMSSIVRYFIQMSMVAVLLVYFIVTGAVRPHLIVILVIPLILMWLGLLGMGCGIIVSSLTTKYRDLAVLVSFGISLWMYATPVVYPLSTIPDGWIRNIIMINPVTAPIELYRYALLGNGTIMFLSMILSLVITVFVSIVGIMIFNKVERTFMDTV